MIRLRRGGIMPWFLAILLLNVIAYINLPQQWLSGRVLKIGIRIRHPLLQELYTTNSGEVALVCSLVSRNSRKPEDVSSKGTPCVAIIDSVGLANTLDSQ